MSERDLPDREVLGEDLEWLDRIVRSGELLSVIWDSKSEDIPPNPAQYEHGVQLGHDQMVKYYGWYFLTEHFTDMPGGNISEEVARLKQGFKLWKQSVLFEEPNISERRQFIEDLTLFKLAKIARCESQKIPSSIKDESGEEMRRYWLYVREITTAAVETERRTIST
ncbi:hypothetical protein A3J17_02300 [Candidatus Curtissbacteria bacterium RIFCSPLOWO2_02_FULL_40_11]|uniref:Uncharacterized protein n=1 Tax=Candidatus Curtissbacteria bacterium RIFCSPHIGHO2_02_FULL_40_16b TaxID=1797714 RepID=A0A1F5G985_9BACT|nr:MAG: hypothetical protein A3D04_00905 [Candidatus Curtissbacteria bacterium RIFCSPHIGHO2_02_FULL_40_16b]OGD99599.1 MAG: hypothetical protein A3J17_02300 [Candidatus Curtissbacteria bacterium RIFCSPLOWO2_02_FULL_40_11]